MFVDLADVVRLRISWDFEKGLKIFFTNGMMVTSGDFAETVVRKNKHWEEEK